MLRLKMTFVLICCGAILLTGCTPKVSVVNGAGIPIPCDYLMEKSVDPPMMMNWVYAYWIPVDKKQGNQELLPVYILPEEVLSGEIVEIPENAKRIGMIMCLRNPKSLNHRVSRVGSADQKLFRVQQGNQQIYELIIDGPITSEVATLGARVDLVDSKDEPIFPVFEPVSLKYKFASY